MNLRKITRLYQSTKEDKKILFAKSALPVRRNTKKKLIFNK